MESAFCLIHCESEGADGLLEEVILIIKMGHKRFNFGSLSVDFSSSKVACRMQKKNRDIFRRSREATELCRVL